jgi:hypothetical protein
MPRISSVWRAVAEQTASRGRVVSSRRGSQRARMRGRPVRPDLGSIIRGRAPREVVIQITDRCNAVCPQCAMRRCAGFERSTMPTDTALDAIARAAAAGVNAVAFTGGEPLLDVAQVSRYVRYARQRGIPTTRTGTNGYIFAGSDTRQAAARAARLADVLVSAGLQTLSIGLDSADPATHESTRGLPGVVAGIARALPVLHEAGLYPTAHLAITRAPGGRLLPRWEDGPDAFAAKSRSGLRSLFSRAVDLGFTIADVRYPTSAEVVRDRAAAARRSRPAPGETGFSRAEKREILAALRDVIPEFRSRIRVVTPLSSVDALLADYAGAVPRPGGFACRGGVDYVYVDTRGRAFPCGVRREDELGQYAALDYGRLERVPHCRRCDWERFRDPSELFGPVAGLPRLAATAARSIEGRDRRLRLWRQDVRYAVAAGFFDGRRPPDPTRLGAFAPRVAARTAAVSPADAGPAVFRSSGVGPAVDASAAPPAADASAAMRR